MGKFVYTYSEPKEVEEKEGVKKKSKGFFQPGNTYGSKGRPKGLRTNAYKVKDMVFKTFIEEEDEDPKSGKGGLGGIEGMVKWAKKSDHNRQAFYMMMVKMLPTNIELDANVTHQLMDSTFWVGVVQEMKKNDTQYIDTVKRVEAINGEKNSGD